MIYIISGYFLLVLVACWFKKVNGYQAFSKGVQGGLKIVINMFGCMLCFTLAIKCLESCGVLDDIKSISSNGWFIEIFVQMLIRPFSSGSSMTIMLSIYEKYGVDSVAAIASTFVHSTCDTLFYIVIFYFSSINVVKYKKAFRYGLITVIIGYLLIFIFIYFLF